MAIINMINFRNMILGYSVFMAIQIFFPKVLSHTSNDDDFMTQNQKSQSRQNYIIRRALENEILREKEGLVYETLVPSTEELPELVVDYANMIRNDIILMDNSVQTRTRKRGNTKEDIPQPATESPCSCESNRREHFLGDYYHPKYIQSITCNSTMCAEPYQCQKTYYDITVLRKTKGAMDTHLSGTMSYFNHSEREQLTHWIAEPRTVITGCICTKSYFKPN